MGAESHVEGRV